MSDENRRSQKVTIYHRDQQERNSSEHVKAEEVKIDVEGEQQQQPPPFSRSFRVRSTGCIGTLAGLVAGSLLFLVFLPLGLIALSAAGIYLGWKFRHLLRNR
jgi:hypothetical protein